MKDFEKYIAANQEGKQTTVEALTEYEAKLELCKLMDWLEAMEDRFTTHFDIASWRDL